MRSEIRYVANDGAEFKDKAAANAHDALIDRCDLATEALGERERDGLRSGKGYVQHDVDVVTGVKRALLLLLHERYPSYGLGALNPATVHPMSSVGRIASEAAAPLAKAWGRLCCIDELGREWEQPCFANHPEPGAREVVRGSSSSRGVTRD